MFDYLVNVSLKRMLHEIKTKVYHKLTDLTIMDFSKQEQNFYLNMLTQDVNLFHDNYFLPKFTILIGIQSFAISVITLFSLNWELAASFTVAAAIYLVISPLFSHVLQRKTEDYSQHNDKFLKVITKFLGAFSVIHLLGTQKNYEVKNRVEDENVEVSRQQFEFTRDTLGDYAMALSLLFQVVCMAVGAIFVFNGNLTTGILLASVQLLNGVFNPLQNIANARNYIKGSSDLVDRMNHYLSLKDNEAAKNDCPEITSVDYNSVEMTFDKRQLYHGLTQSFEKNKRYVIVGESGSGKSTLVKLLLGYFSDYAGTITINHSLSVKDIKQSSLFQHVGYVARDDFMIDGSIADNILVGRSIDLTKFNSLFALLKITPEFLNRTISGQATTTVSTGEKQRIDIARAMINEPEVIIFDEPTSNLDPVNTEIIGKMILSIKNKVVIVISHNQDKDYLDRFDQVIRIGDQTEKSQASQSLKAKLS